MGKSNDVGVSISHVCNFVITATGMVIRFFIERAGVHSTVEICDRNDAISGEAEIARIGNESVGSSGIHTVGH